MFAAYRWFRFSIAFIAGGVLIATGLPSIGATAGFMQRSAIAQARVVGNQPYTDPNGNVSYCPVLVYTTATGRTMQAVGDQVCQDNPFRAGRVMMVRYDTKRPSTMRVDNLLGIWGSMIWSVGAGLFIEGVAVLVLLWRFRARLGAVTRALRRAG